MKILVDSDTEEDFIEIQLSEKEIKDLLSYCPIDGTYHYEEEFQKPLNIFIRRK